MDGFFNALENFNVENLANNNLIRRNMVIQNNDINGKRFFRYTEKAKKYIFDNYLSYFLDDFNDEDTKKIFDLNDFVRYMFKRYYIDAYEYAFKKLEEDEKAIDETSDNLETEGQKNFDEDDDFCFSDSINKAMELKFAGTIFESFFLSEIFNLDVYNSMFVYEYLTNPYSEKIGYHEDIIGFDELINNEFAKTCKNFIQIRAIELQNTNEINITNYFLTLPDKKEHVIIMFDELINRINSDIKNLAANHFDRQLADNFSKTGHFELIEDFKDSQSKIKSLERKIVEKDYEIEKLKDRLAEPKKVDDKTELLLEENEALIRQNNKLKEKYNELLIELKSVKSIMYETEKTDEIKEIELLHEINLDGKYLFICDEFSCFEKAVKSEFKNAVFSDGSNIHINDTYDLVILVYGHLSHSAYFKAKEQCKLKNIPFVHCKFLNIELIKELIWNSLNL